MSAFKYEYLVNIPDFPNSLDKRMEVRPKHLSNLKPHIEAGQVVFGGAVLSKEPVEGQTPAMTGSMMLIKANSEQDVRDWVANDPYTKGGVWDVNNMTITNFRCAIRTAM